MVLNKYAAALLNIALVIFGGLAVIEVWNIDAVAQFVALAGGSIVVYYAPLLDAKWAGALKTGAAVVIAIVAALVPLVNGGDYSGQSIALVVVAGLNALATEVGVKLRKDDVALAA